MRLLLGAAQRRGKAPQKSRDFCADPALEPQGDISISWHEQPTRPAIIPSTHLAILTYTFQKCNINCVRRRSPRPFCLSLAEHGVFNLKALSCTWSLKKFQILTPVSPEDTQHYTQVATGARFLNKSIFLTLSGAAPARPHPSAVPTRQ